MAWLTAAEALAILGVLPQTLYANVSRGKIRAKPDPAEARRSLYNRDDVQHLADRHAGRRKTETVAKQTIAFGDPVMPSSLSTIAQGRLWYRGRDATVLSETATLEDIAGLLWGATNVRFDALDCVRGSGAPLPPLSAAFLALAERAGRDAPSRGRSTAALHVEAAEVMATLTCALLGPSSCPGAEPVHERIAETWRRPDAADGIRRALVLLADHELNASTFATRVAASTGASLSASVLAGLSTLTGPLHGGASAAAQALGLRAAQIGAEEAVRASLAQGLLVPAFGHPLYAEQDVRAAALLKRFTLTPAFSDLAGIGRRLLGEEPNIDFALAAFVVAHDLPEGAPLVLFALARCVGWLAHAFEQIEQGRLIRPRAEYVGPAVGLEQL